MKGNLSMRESGQNHASRWWLSMWMMGFAVGGMGCGREEIPEWTNHEQVLEWQESEDEEEQLLFEITQSALLEHGGTWQNPKMLGDPEFDTDHLKQGQEVYTFYCAQCHGVSGDGKGDAADILRPRPRDYRQGKFKFTSTPYGYKPRREDLMNTLMEGVSGTSMPSFALLSEQELEAVLDYVIALSRRGELEDALLIEAEEVAFEEGDTEEETAELRAEYIADLVERIADSWDKAESSTVYPITSRPQFTEEHVKRGYKAFLQVGCHKCHGADGRGATEGDVRKDSWGFVTKAADITSGMLHGGDDPLDVYRRIHSGINGTPMPNFSKSLQDDPDKLWDLTAYVLYLANERRRGKSIDPIEFPKPGESVLEATMELSESVAESPAELPR